MAEPQLRTVTAAFCDLVDSVGLAARLSEHAYFNEVLQPFYAIAKEVITDHGGKIRPFTRRRQGPGRVRCARGAGG